MMVRSHVSINSNKLEAYPFLNESVMKAYLLENEEVLQLDRYEEVKIHGYEVQWTRGGQEGIIDLLVSYDRDNLAVVELKNDILNLKHLDQLEDYFKNGDLPDKTLDLFPELRVKDRSELIGVLVGTGIDSELLKKVEPSYKLSNGSQLVLIVMNRFKSGGNIFVFSESKTAPKKAKDYTKYRFNNNVYGNGRLVLALVKQCVLDGKDPQAVGKGFDWNDAWTFLRNINDFQVREDGKRKYEGFYFLNGDKDELVVIGGEKFAVSSWWGIDDMPRLLHNAKELGYIVDELM